MQNLRSNPALVAALGAALQPHIDVFVEATKTARNGYVRFDQDILDGDGKVVATNLLTQFRTLAMTIDPKLEFAKTQQVVQFVAAAIPTLRMPEIHFTDYPAKPATTRVDPVTGEIRNLKALKAQVVASFGKPPSKLSPEAQAANAAATSKWAAIIAAAQTNAPAESEQQTAPVADTASAL